MGSDDERNVGSILFALVALTALVLSAVSAYAFDYVGSSSDCAFCHAGIDPIQGLGMDYSYGPHGDYAATSNDCKSCHTAHDDARLEAPA